MGNESNAQLAADLKIEAARLGFDKVGIAPAVSPAGYSHYQDWLAEGFAAGMNYMHRQAEARSHPAHMLEGVRSVVVCAMIYGRKLPDRPSSTSGKIARYARGADYHDLLWRRLESLLSWVQVRDPSIRGRAVADTAPLLERDFAWLSGLGWIGKNTMLIDRRIGSYTVLGSLLLDCDLEYDHPHETGHCGTCTRCLDYCPTDAFDGPFRLDANRCISYWTIEHRGQIPDAFADKLDGWAFGCDICQEVCPWNRKAPDGREASLGGAIEWRDVDLIEWLSADPAAFRRRIKGTAMSRAKRSGLLRNAALILGQRQLAGAIPALIDRLSDEDPVIRGACAWALGRFETESARQALIVARSDPDETVREVVERSLLRTVGEL